MAWASCRGGRRPRMRSDLGVTGWPQCDGCVIGRAADAPARAGAAGHVDSTLYLGLIEHACSWTTHRSRAGCIRRRLIGYMCNQASRAGSTHGPAAFHPKSLHTPPPRAEKRVRVAFCRATHVFLLQILAHRCCKLQSDCYGGVARSNQIMQQNSRVAVAGKSPLHHTSTSNALMVAAGRQLSTAVAMCQHMACWLNGASVRVSLSTGATAQAGIVHKLSG
mmetsp:Transcript_37408/g.110467  ORF Transcript_37408/g.110467 Transcript_37408/m.110467 type:complete len:221 (-) Transcript_37408:1534-2196(-)|eukprot:111793-Chlamydomonas_euryale.AAC.3